VVANLGLIAGLVLVAIQINQSPRQLASNEKAMLRTPAFVKALEEGVNDDA